MFLASRRAFEATSSQPWRSFPAKGLPENKMELSSTLSTYMKTRQLPNSLSKAYPVPVKSHDTLISMIAPTLASDPKAGYVPIRDR